MRLCDTRQNRGVKSVHTACTLRAPAKPPRGAVDLLRFQDTVQISDKKVIRSARRRTGGALCGRIGRCAEIAHPTAVHCIRKAPSMRIEVPLR